MYSILFLFSALMVLTAAWLSPNLSVKQLHHPQRGGFASRSTTLFASGDDAFDPDEDDDEVIDLPDDDWRAFRAKLVMGTSGAPVTASSSSTTTASTTDEGDLDGIGALFAEEEVEVKSTTTSSSRMASGMTPLDPSQWAYDSGKVIEQGAVILGGVEQDFGFGLRQQYFHKAAILVLDHEESTFTKGIILNRPTDLLLEDDINEGVQWRVWFGGDVQGLESDIPDIVCLHSLKNSQVTRASIPVMKDIQWTSFDNAKRLVQVGAAKPTDFWVFCGYAGWGPQQLMGELERKSWYMVATDSQTLLKELGRQSAGTDPRDAGLETWMLLMQMIGRGDTAKEYSGGFDDLMLKEWALRHLLSSDMGGGAGKKLVSPQQGLTMDVVDRFLQRVSPLSGGSSAKDVMEGTLVRASAMERSPFLLDSQELHKSVVLVIGDDEHLSVGAILNRPAAKGIDIEITEKETGKSKTITVPLRFGGQYAVKGSEPLLWLHCHPVLRAAKIGSPVGQQEGDGITGSPTVDGIWKCTAEDVIAAVGQGLATPEDFIVVSGVSVWTKGDGLPGMPGEVQAGNFEVIPSSRTKAVWDTLSKQEVLTDTNLEKNLAIANQAWSDGIDKKNGKNGSLPVSGLGEGFDEDDDSLVYETDVKVSKLSDDALGSWVATFLLGAPTLRG